jgi:hypothetical protein
MLLPSRGGPEVNSCHSTAYPRGINSKNDILEIVVVQTFISLQNDKRGCAGNDLSEGGTNRWGTDSQGMRIRTTAYGRKKILAN